MSAGNAVPGTAAPEDGRLAAVVFRALADGERALAVGMVELHWEELAARAPHVIRAVAEALPPEELERSPRWSRLRANTRLLLRGPAAGTVLAREEGRELVLHLTQLTDASREARDAGRAEAAREAAERAVSAFHLIPPARRARIGAALPRLLVEWGRSVAAAGPGQGHRELFERAYAWAVSHSDHRAAVEAASEIATDDMIAGRCAAGLAWAERAVALHRANTGESGPPSSVRLALALAAADDLDLDQALRLLDGSSRVPSVDHDLVAAAFRAYWRAHRPGVDLRAVRREFESLAARRPPASRLGELVHAHAAARLLAVDGQPQRAVHLIVRAAAGPYAAWITTARAAAHLQLAELRAAETSAQAGAALDGGAPRCQAEARVLQAAVELRRGRVHDAVATFEEAHALVAAHRVGAALLVLPLDDLKRLTRAAFGAQPPSLLARAIAALGALPTRTAAADRLTDRETRLARFVAADPDATVEHIAAQLGVSRNTIKTQMGSLYRKLGTSTRRDMVRLAREGGHIE